MYIGGLFVIFGAGLALASASIVMLAGVFGLGVHLFDLHYGEPALKGRFGESYMRYKAYSTDGYLGHLHQWADHCPLLLTRSILPTRIRIKLICYIIVNFLACPFSIVTFGLITNLTI